MMDPSNPTAKPLPRITPDNRAFWEACRRHELLVPWCDACDRAHWPPGPVCPFCFGAEPGWRRASGRGQISAWVVVHKDWLPAFREDLPYNGLPVEVVFDDVSETATLARFRPRAPSS
jgi:hypothetical protein